MSELTQPDGQGAVIAVVGGGASGSLTAIQLLRHAAALRLPLHVVLIDRHARHGLGQAYSTEHRAHLLNAMAGQMSALPDDPDHLVRWAAEDGEPDDTAHRARPGDADVGRTAFLPRQDYGRYLRDTLADAEHAALPVARLARVSSDVLAVRPTAAGRPVRLILSDGQLDADVVVLATGNAPARLPFDAPPSDRIITQPWLPGELARVTTSADCGVVVIVGTGLTMVDLAIAITASKPDAVIHAISRHGLLPRTHPGTPPRGGSPLWLPVITRTTGPVRLADLMWQVRSTIAAQPANWHAVMDALRPFVPGLWRRMPEHDKRLFLRHVARYWEIHRHLVPPATASRITALRATGRLVIHSGQVIGVVQDADQLRILIDAGDDVLQLGADWLINGTGPAADITATASPLLRDLFSSGLARPGPLRLGIDADASGAVLDRAGRPAANVFTLGPPLRGLWYETTAIPEIRDQAATLAQRITSDRQLYQRPGSAA
jgi:uncharacterized NAD(P)/FAD-binding protein YdhS